MTKAVLGTLCCNKGWTLLVFAGGFRVWRRHTTRNAAKTKFKMATFRCDNRQFSCVVHLFHMLKGTVQLYQCDDKVIRLADDGVLFCGLRYAGGKDIVYAYVSDVSLLRSFMSVVGHSLILEGVCVRWSSAQELDWNKNRVYLVIGKGFGSLFSSKTLNSEMCNFPYLLWISGCLRSDETYK